MTDTTEKPVLMSRPGAPGYPVVTDQADLPYEERVSYLLRSLAAMAADASLTDLASLGVVGVDYVEFFGALVLLARSSDRVGKVAALTLILHSVGGLGAAIQMMRDGLSGVASEVADAFTPSGFSFADLEGVEQMSAILLVVRGTVSRLVGRVIGVSVLEGQMLAMSLPDLVLELLVELPGLLRFLVEVAGMCGLSVAGLPTAPAVLVREAKALMSKTVGCSGAGVISYRAASFQYAQLVGRLDALATKLSMTAAQSRRSEPMAVVLQMQLEALKKWWSGTAPPGVGTVPPPLVWCLTGVAGCGKSELMKSSTPIVVGPFQLPGSARDSGIVYRSGESDHFNDDVEVGALALCVDDPLLMAASIANGGAEGPMRTFLQIAGGAPGFLRCAEVAKKGKKVLHPLFACVTCNDRLFTDMHHVVLDENAWKRRMGLVTKVFLAADATNAEGMLDYDKYQARVDAMGQRGAMNATWRLGVTTWNISKHGWFPPDPVEYPGVEAEMPAGDFVYKLREWTLLRATRSVANNKRSDLCGCGCGGPSGWCLKDAGITADQLRLAGVEYEPSGPTAVAVAIARSAGARVYHFAGSSTGLSRWMLSPPSKAGTRLMMTVHLAMRVGWPVVAGAFGAVVTLVSLCYAIAGFSWAAFLVCALAADALVAFRYALPLIREVDLRSWVALDWRVREFALRAALSNMPWNSAERVVARMVGMRPLPVTTFVSVAGFVTALCGLYGLWRVSRVVKDTLVPPAAPSGGLLGVPYVAGVRKHSPGFANVEPLSVLYSVKSDTVSVANAPNVYATMVCRVTLDGVGSVLALSTGNVIVMPAHLGVFLKEAPQGGVRIDVQFDERARIPTVSLIVHPAVVELNLERDYAVVRLGAELPRTATDMAKSLFPMTPLECGYKEFETLNVLTMDVSGALVLRPTGRCVLKQGAPKYGSGANGCYGLGARSHWECHYESASGDCGSILLDAHGRALGRLIASARAGVLSGPSSIFMTMEPLSAFGEVREYKPSALFLGPPVPSLSSLRSNGVVMLASSRVIPIASLGPVHQTQSIKTRLGPGSEYVVDFATACGLSIGAVPTLGWVANATSPSGYGDWQLNWLLKDKGIVPHLGEPNKDLVEALLVRCMVATVRDRYPKGLRKLTDVTMVCGDEPCTSLRLASSNGYGGPVGRKRALLEVRPEGVRAIKPEYWLRVEEFLRAAQVGQARQAVVRAAAKDEARDRTPEGGPKSARVIWVEDCVSSLGERVFASYATAAVSALPGSRVGINVYKQEEASIVRDAHLAMEVAGGCYELDGVGMDCNQCRSTMEMAIRGLSKVVELCGGGREAALQCSGVYAVSLDPFWVVSNDVVSRRRCLPSGSGATTYVNTYSSCAVHLLCCVTSSAECRALWTRLAAVPVENVGVEWLKDFYSAMSPANIYGDDVSTCFRDEDFNVQAGLLGLQFENQYGRNVKSTPDAITFLRRNYVPRGSDRVWAKLALSSIAKMLAFETPPADPAELPSARRQRVDSARRELCLHGPEVYAAWLPLLLRVWDCVSLGVEKDFAYVEDPWGPLDAQSDFDQDVDA